MRLTIIVPDNMVGIDGQFYEIDLAGKVPANLHALQWYGDHGELELNVNGVPSNEPIQSLDEYQTVIQAWQNVHAAATTPPPPPPQPPIEEAKWKKIAAIKAEAYVLLAPTDWYVIRQQETGDPIPQDVAGYRAAVRAASDAAEAAVQALDNVEAVQAYTVNWPAQVV